MISNKITVAKTRGGLISLKPFLHCTVLGGWAVSSMGNLIEILIRRIVSGKKREFEIQFLDAQPTRQPRYSSVQLKQNWNVALSSVIYLQIEGKKTFSKLTKRAPFSEGPKGLDKREMFGDQTPSNFVWCPNILRFGYLAWYCLIVFGRVW